MGGKLSGVLSGLRTSALASLTQFSEQVDGELYALRAFCYTPVN